MTDKTIETFQTADFILASYLLAKGNILDSVIPAPFNSNRKLFVFQEVKETQLSEFYAGKADVNVMAYDSAQNRLRDLLREAR